MSKAKGRVESKKGDGLFRLVPTWSFDIATTALRTRDRQDAIKRLNRFMSAAEKINGAVEFCAGFASDLKEGDSVHLTLTVESEAEDFLLLILLLDAAKGIVVVPRLDKVRDVEWQADRLGIDIIDGPSLWCYFTNDSL